MASEIGTHHVIIVHHCIYDCFANLLGTLRNTCWSKLWRPRFSVRFINPNDPVNRVDCGQTTVNLGHHLKNIPDNPNDTPSWTHGQGWVKTLVKPLKLPLTTYVAGNFCRVLQISPKHFKISHCKSCVFCRGTQLSCWVALLVWSVNWWKMQVNASRHYSLEPRFLQSSTACYSKSVDQNPIRPL
jgi:hypothetical protein